MNTGHYPPTWRYSQQSQYIWATDPGGGCYIEYKRNGTFNIPGTLHWDIAIPT